MSEPMPAPQQETEPEEPANLDVFFYYNCPYAYVGWKRVQRLAGELPLAVRWFPWEIHPTTAPMGEPRSNQTGPMRLGGWVGGLAEEMGETLTRPPLHLNTNLALRGCEVAKDAGPEAFERYHRLAFEAVWRDARNLGDPQVVLEVATKAGLDARTFLDAARHPAYGVRLAEVDRVATALGVQRVPTFVFGDQRIVGNDPFEASLRQPLLAFLERRRALGDEETTTLREDVGIAALD